MVYQVALGVLLAAELASRIEKIIASEKRRRQRKKNQQLVPQHARKVVIVSTAAIPWMTGTAVNPTLRAAFLAHLTDNEVTLLLPWLAPSDQKLVFPNNLVFEQPHQQEECIKEWVVKRTGFKPSFRIAFYSGRYDKMLLGIFPVGDPIDAVARGTDLVVLEEPEHINWFHCGPQWTEVFNHVVGVIHTNQAELGRRNAGPLMALAAWLLTFMLSGMHCHKTIKLSHTIQKLPRQETSFVHGAAPKFLEEGARKAGRGDVSDPEARKFSKGAYCLGKIVWGKGWEELMKLMEVCKKSNSLCASTVIDCFGDGEARAKIEAKCVRKGLAMKFHPKTDHLDPNLQDYKVFVNASTSDVVATTSIEALAMGKWLICAEHPCNEFASAFPNALVYKTPQEFCKYLQHALDNDPAPLDEQTLRQLGWEAATERFLQVADMKPEEWPSRPVELIENGLWHIYRAFTSIEPFRQLVCAGTNTRHTPKHVTDYDPKQRDPLSPGELLRKLVYSFLGTVTFNGPNWSVNFAKKATILTQLHEELLASHRPSLL